MAKATLELFADFFNAFNQQYQLLQDIAHEGDLLREIMMIQVGDLEKICDSPEALPLLDALKINIRHAQNISFSNARRLYFLKELFEKGRRLFGDSGDDL